LKNPIREEEYLARVQSTFFFSLCVFFCVLLFFFLFHMVSINISLR